MSGTTSCSTGHARISNGQRDSWKRRRNSRCSSVRVTGRSPKALTSLTATQSCFRPVRGAVSRGCSHATKRPRYGGARPARFSDLASGRACQARFMGKIRVGRASSRPHRVRAVPDRSSSHALRSAAVTERVQVLRDGQAHAYVVAEEHEDGSLLLAPEPAPSGPDKVPAEDGRADIPVAVGWGCRDPPGERPDGRLRAEDGR